MEEVKLVDLAHLKAPTLDPALQAAPTDLMATTTTAMMCPEVEYLACPGVELRIPSTPDRDRPRDPVAAAATTTTTWTERR